MSQKLITKLKPGPSYSIGEKKYKVFVVGELVYPKMESKSALHCEERTQVVSPLKLINRVTSNLPFSCKRINIMCTLLTSFGTIRIKCIVDIEVYCQRVYTSAT